VETERPMGGCIEKRRVKNKTPSCHTGAKANQVCLIPSHAQKKKKNEEKRTNSAGEKNEERTATHERKNWGKFVGRGRNG